MEVPPQISIPTMTNDESHFRSSTTEIVSSLQFEKKVKSRSYSSQFTLNDDIIVAVDRREEYLPIENKVSIEVDITLGFCDDEVPAADQRYTVRLNDMAAQNAWVFRMINYDTFVDKTISDSIKDEAMELNKLYLIKHEHITRTEDKLSFGDSFDPRVPTRRPLRTTTSQFNPSPVVLRNELLIFTGEKQCHFVKDQSFTSNIDIDLSKTNKCSSISIPISENTTVHTADPTKRAEVIVQDPGIIVLDHVDVHDIYEPDVPTLSLTIENTVPVPYENVEHSKENSIITEICPEPSLLKGDNTDFNNVEKFEKPIRKNEEITDTVENIPFAEETEDEDIDKGNGGTPLSKYLQYYLPTFKSNEDDNPDRHSDVSTGLESNTDVDSVDGYLEEAFMVESNNNIVSLGKFDYFSDKDDSIFVKKINDEIDRKEDESKNEDLLTIIYNDTMKFENIICQENMVLYVDAINCSDILNLDISQIRKDSLSLPNVKEMEPNLKMLCPSDDDDFVPVAVRRLQYEMLVNPCGRLSTSLKSKPNNINLITSDNYTNLIEVDQLFKAETSISENKENENDKESSISFSSGSMIVKDIPSDENNDFFIIHNNIDVSSPNNSVEDCNDDKFNNLEEVDEESEDDDASVKSIKTSSSRKTAETPEAESEPSLSESETDATSASSFTTSVKIEDVAVTMLVKTPIECIPGKFEKFLEERKKSLSERHISSLPVSSDSRSESSYASDTSEDHQNDSSNKFADDRGYINSPLTNISNTSSVSSSVLGSSSSEEGADTQTLIRIIKADSNLMEKEGSSSFTSVHKTKDYSNENEIETADKYIADKISVSIADDDVFLKEKDGNKFVIPILNATENKEEESYSETSSSSDSGQDEEQQKSPYEPLLDNYVSDKGEQDDYIETSKSNLEKSFEAKDNEIKSSGTEDSSSSSSDYVNIPKKFTLRHGESIENIEELMMQPPTKIHRFPSIPMGKQNSMPNISGKNDPIRVESKSIDHREKLLIPENYSTIERQNITVDLMKKNDRNSFSSSGTLSSSDDEESENPQGVFTDHREKFQNNTNVEKIEKQKSISEPRTKHSSPSSDSLSSTEDEESERKPGIECVNDEKEIPEIQRESDDGKDSISKHSSLDSITIRSSSDEELHANKSIEIMSANGNPQLLEPEKHQSMDTDNDISRHSASSSNRASNIYNREISEDVNQNKGAPRIEASQRQKERISSSSSDTLSSSSSEESEDVQKNKLQSSDGKEQPLVSLSSSSYSLSSSGDEEPESSKEIPDLDQEIISTDKESHPYKECTSTHSSPRSQSLRHSLDNETDRREILENGTSNPTQRFVPLFVPSSRHSTPRNDGGSELHNNQSIDHTVIFQNSNNERMIQSKKKFVEKPMTGYSSSSSHSSYSSNDEESQDKEEIFTKPNEIEAMKSSGNRASSPYDSSYTSSTDEESELIPAKNLEMNVENVEIGSQRDSISNKSSSSNSFSSSGDKEIKAVQPKPIDHIEKFESPNCSQTIKKVQKESHEISSSSSSDTFFSSSNEEVHLNKSIDHREKFEDPNEVKKIEYLRSINRRDISVPEHSFPSHRTIPTSECEELEAPTETQSDLNDVVLEETRETKVMEEHETSSTSSESDSLTSSSDDESDILHNKSIDHKEKFENLHNNITIQNQKKPNFEIDRKRLDSSSSSYTSSNMSNEESDGGPVSAVDHTEKFETPINVGSLECQRKINHENKLSPKSSLQGSPISVIPYKEEVNLIPNQSTEHIEKFVISCESTKIKSPRKKYDGSNHATSLCLEDSSNDELYGLENQTSDCQENIENCAPLFANKKSVSIHSSRSSGTTSRSSDGEKDRKKIKSPINKVVSQRPIENISHLIIDNQDSSSQYSTSTASEESLILNKEEEKSEDRRYQTLPINRLTNSVPIKEKSKSLDKPVMVEEEDSLDILKKGHSTVNMVEKRYSESTETWSRQSPVEKRNIRNKPPSKKVNVTKSSEIPMKRSMGPFTTRPRPVPSYLSPVNSFPYVPSDHEYYSNDSIVNDYSTDSNAEEIKTRHGSLPDFIKELSCNKIVDAVPPKQHRPNKVPVNVKPSKPIVDLNYGDENIYVNNPKEKGIRRTSNTSITTDGSYLDYPAISDKPLKSSLARLDSFSSVSSSLNASQSKQVKKTNKPALSSNRSSDGTISTSASSRRSNSKPQPNPKVPKSEPLDKSLNNQTYKEKSQMINDSSVYPVQSNNLNRKKIPSISESSEYSSTSDEELSSSKNA